MTETLSADLPDPAPNVQRPVHGINQTRLRNSRERKLCPRIERSSQSSGGAAPDSAASAPRLNRHIGAAGKVSHHHRRQRRSVSVGIPHRRPIASRRTPPPGNGARRNAPMVASPGADRKRSKS